MIADRAFSFLKADPKHPSLHFKKVGRFWSARVGLHHRAVAVEVPDGMLWFWIGTHADSRPLGWSCELTFYHVILEII